MAIFEPDGKNAIHDGVEHEPAEARDCSTVCLAARQVGSNEMSFWPISHMDPNDLARIFGAFERSGEFVTERLSDFAWDRVDETGHCLNLYFGREGKEA